MSIQHIAHIRHSLVCLLCFALSVLSTSAQKRVNNLGKVNTIPNDPQVRIGKLKNGFTYYIRKNDTPEKEIYMQMVVGAGLYFEDKDQLELAHLLEHVGLRSTVHFPQGIKNWMKEKGLKTMNASTAGDYTRYYFAMPSQQPKLFSEGLLVLHDWAQGMKVDPKQTDEERGAVQGEIRMGDSNTWRMYQKKKYQLTNNENFHPSITGKHVENVKTFKQESIVRFYKEWYRPDLEAAVIVGDIDVNQVEQQVIALFSGLKMPARPRKVEDFKSKWAAKLSGKNELTLFTDQAMPNLTMEIYAKRAQEKVQGPVAGTGSYQRSITDDLYKELMKGRLSALIQKYNAPFDNISHSVDRNFRDSKMETLYTYVSFPDAKSLEPAYKAVIAEFERIRRDGFTLAEFDKAKAAILLEKGSLDRSASELLASKYTAHYIDKAAIPAPADEMKLIRQLTASITLQEVNAVAKSWLGIEKNHNIFISAPEKEKTLLPVEADLVRWDAEVKKEKLTPYQDHIKPEALLTAEQLARLSAGVKYTQTEDKTLGLVNMKLANGVSVVLKSFKPRGYQNDKILLEGFSPGGSSLYKGNDAIAAAGATGLIVNSGVGGLDKFALGEFFTGKSVMVFPSINSRSEEISGSSVPEETELMLQLLYLYVVSPNKNAAAFTDQLTTARNTNALTNTASNRFYNAINEALPLQERRSTEAQLQLADFERAYEIYKERFSDAGDFTFVISGDFDLEKMKTLVLKYLGNLPAAGRKERPEPLQAITLKGAGKQTLYGGEESNAMIGLVYSGNYTPNEESNVWLTALTELLEFKLTQRLREKEAGTYHVSVRNRHYRDPSGCYYFLIDFISAPNNTEKMIAAAKEEIAIFRQQGPDADSFQKTIALAARELSEKLSNNAFWSEYLTRQLQDGANLNDVLSRKALLEKLTADDMKSAAAKYLTDDHLMQFILLPDSMKPIK